VDARTFALFRDLVYERSGISLGEGKETLVSARLGKRMRALGIKSHREYLDYALAHEDDGEVVYLLNAISTNFTSFFREPAHFDMLRALLQQWLGTGQQRLRLWCAASSTGEEPYTLAMLVREAIGSRPVDARILATDISTRVLEVAVKGEYDAERLEPVPLSLRTRYFDDFQAEGETRYRARDVLKQLLVFRRLNLSTPPFPMSGPLDAVFCRNVMIYFDQAVRARLVSEVVRLLKPGGYLFVGHSESLTGVSAGLRAVQPSVYAKPE
jgi:chemotaxis protein methyltransferase CheR